jgi:hypothetical protein
MKKEIEKAADKLIKTGIPQRNIEFYVDIYSKMVDPDLGALNDGDDSKAIEKEFEMVLRKATRGHAPDDDIRKARHYFHRVLYSDEKLYHFPLREIKNKETNRHRGVALNFLKFSLVYDTRLFSKRFHYKEIAGFIADSGFDKKCNEGNLKDKAPKINWQDVLTDLGKYEWLYRELKKDFIGVYYDTSVFSGFANMVVTYIKIAHELTRHPARVHNQKNLPLYSDLLTTTMEIIESQKK